MWTSRLIIPETLRLQLTPRAEDGKKRKWEMYETNRFHLSVLDVRTTLWRILCDLITHRIRQNRGKKISYATRLHSPALRSMRFGSHQLKFWRHLSIIWIPTHGQMESHFVKQILCRWYHSLRGRVSMMKRFLFSYPFLYFYFWV